MGISLFVSGRWACFTRPELKVEGVSYDVMTPSAARGILQAFYWKPEINWIVDGILVCNKIQSISIMKNYITSKVPKRMKPIKIEDCRDQRNVTILKDVAYVIQAHFNILSGENNPIKHSSMFIRRVESGQYFSCPYLGIREYAVEDFDLVKNLPVSQLRGKQDLGMLLHSINFEDNFKPTFFKAILNDGYLTVPPIEKLR